MVNHRLGDRTYDRLSSITWAVFGCVSWGQELVRANVIKLSRCQQGFEFVLFIRQQFKPDKLKISKSDSPSFICTLISCGCPFMNGLIFQCSHKELPIK